MIKKYADRFFEWFCNPEYYEDIKGDLDETYNNTLTNLSQEEADRQFAKEVLLLFRPSIIKPIQFLNLQHALAMVQNYFKIGMRNLVKHSTNTTIHILGLAIGLAAFLLINQYVVFERSYDRHFSNATQIYRLSTDSYYNGQLEVQDAMSYSQGPKVLEERLPKVIGSTITLQNLGSNFMLNGQPVKEDIVFADSNFLNIFDYEVLQGDPSTFLREPKTVVLTESYAKKYFGNKNPLEENMILSVFGKPNGNLKVMGVIADPPEQTHYKFNILMAASTIRERMISNGWNQNNYYGYVLLDKNADIEKVRNKLLPLSKEILDEEGKDRFFLMPIVDIHLKSTMTYEPEVPGSERAVNFLTIISIFILLIAWINYINLSTARAVERAKEVGMRKVVGASKFQLVGQFLTESFLVNLIAVFIAALLVQLILPYFNQLVGKEILSTIWTDTSFLKTLAIFFGIGTLVTGIYPAFVLSSFKPIGVLKGAFSRTKHGINLRKGLVIFQFAASFILIASTIVVYQQIRYMTSQEMGINPHQVLNIVNPDVNRNQWESFESKHKSFRNSLLQIPAIEEVATIESVPGGHTSDISSWSGEFSVTGLSDPASMTVYVNGMDEKAIDALGLSLVAGRNFSPERAEDSTAVLINESILNLLNLPDAQEVVNKEFNLNGSPHIIVGVLKDFNRSSLKNQIEPTIFFPRKLGSNNVIKLSTADIAATMDQIEEVWQRFFPEAPYDPLFLDEGYERLYQEDKKFGVIFGNFALLAIFVSILGLFALASYLSLQRRKEVGVRKVLGASTNQIILLFFKDFIWLVVIGLVIGTPLVYLSMSDWLNGYAFRIDFPWWALIISMIVLMVLTFLTVSLQTYKVARTNPAETIRTE